VERAGSFGVAIRLPHEQRTNPSIADVPRLVNFKYFFTPKILSMIQAGKNSLTPWS
jgi:hypothetical protein